MGYFITLEGLDFSGKSTALNTIKSQLPDHTVITREPGGTAKSEKIREYLAEHSQELTGLEKLEQFADARQDHVERVIVPALLDDKLVISDRYVGSTYAYQIAGDGLPFEIVDTVTKDLYQKLPLAKPDLTIYFETSNNVRKARMGLRSQDALDAYDESFYERVEHAYMAGIYASSKHVVILNADRAKEDVASELLAIINQFISDGGLN